VFCVWTNWLFSIIYGALHIVANAHRTLDNCIHVDAAATAVIVDDV
jgi:hypothetical protein